MRWTLQPARVGLALLVATLGIVPAISPATATAESIGIPAQVVDLTPASVTAKSFATTEYRSDGLHQGTTTWRVVLGTGNCCEIHTGSSPDGRLFDIAGSYLDYTDDLGQTWKSVRPQEPLVNGEGSVVTAPNGDILGVEWDPYSGDHLLAYKYDAAAKTWSYWENPLHEFFFDRPWLSVVPGPFDTPLGQVPYVSILQGGTGIKDPMFLSTDGLRYAQPTGSSVDGMVASPAAAQWFPIHADPSFDWIQPIRSSPVTPLGAGRAFYDVGNWLFDPADLRWHSWALPDGSDQPTFIQIDSAGRIHDIEGDAKGIDYRISSDGGRTWTDTRFPIPLGSLADFKANLAAGVSAVATRVANVDWVYKFDIRGVTPVLLRTYKLGLGDLHPANGLVVPPAPRYDFKTISILPDGRVVTSFMDTSTKWAAPGSSGVFGNPTPAMAIELDTTFSS